jgi:prophage regulatory protein
MIESKQTRLIRLAEVIRTTGFGKSSIYHWAQAGEFPAPVHVGRSARWVSTEVERWIDGRIIAEKKNR